VEKEFEIVFKHSESVKRKRKIIVTPTFEEAASYAFTQKMILGEKTSGGDWHIFSVVNVTDEPKTNDMKKVAYKNELEEL
tara:strand:+ start:160 stop:399 length:240 start_codon:yes stop_codon:yes gene_type:complete